MDIGKRIKELRKKQNLTQEELGKRIFITDKTVSSWESNRTEPSLDDIVRLSEVFECSASYLLYGDELKNDIETEIKVKLSEEEFNKLIIKMNNDACFVSETKQMDTYYQPKYRKFLKNDDEEVEEWLRIGVRGSKKILNYKHWYQNKYCDEFEVSIDDENNLNKIFNVLDLEVIAVVDKKRRKYMYNDKYEIALDEVKDLGYFIEIEVKHYSHSPLEEYDNLLDVVKCLDLNLNNIDKRGYPYHLIFGK